MATRDCNNGRLCKGFYPPQKSETGNALTEATNQ